MLSDAEKQELIHLAAEGDRGSLERLLLYYSSSLRRYLASKMSDMRHPAVSVDDVLQETFIKAYRDIGTLKHRTPQSFYVWMRTVADNRLRDTFRYQNRAKRQDARRVTVARNDEVYSSMVQLVEMLSDRGDTPGRFAIRREAIEAVQIGLAGLPDDQRQAIFLHYLEGKTLDETAEKMERTTGAIRGLLQRGKKELQTVLIRSSRWIG